METNNFMETDDREIEDMEIDEWSGELSAYGHVRHAIEDSFDMNIDEYLPLGAESNDMDIDDEWNNVNEAIDMDINALEVQVNEQI